MPELSQIHGEKRTFNYKCAGCSNEVQREVNYISTKYFVDEPVMTVVCWCPHCSTSNTITIRFVEYTKSIKVVNTKQSQSLTNEELEI